MKDLGLGELGYWDIWGSGIGGFGYQEIWIPVNREIGGLGENTKYNEICRTGQAMVEQTSFG